MIDIHCHILPSIDDGADSVEETIEMARSAQEQGITTMIATPHHQNGRYDNKKKQVIDQTTELNQILKEQGIDVTIAPGQEVRLYGDMIEDYEKGDILPLNESNYLLIEFPSDHVPAYASRMIYDLRLAGIQPVIAHPERNRAIAENPDKLFDLIEQGALSQLTASSVTGRFGKTIKKFSQQLIDNNLVHFIASDTHNTSNRPNELRMAFDVVEKTTGINTVYSLQENAEILYRGETVYAEPPSRIKVKKFLGIF